MADDDETFEKLCQEAVTACGGDIKAIEAYMEARLGRLPEAVQERIEGRVKDLISFRAPDQSQFDPN